MGSTASDKPEECRAHAPQATRSPIRASATQRADSPQQNDTGRGSSDPPVERASDRRMPEISRFFGIVASMNYDEHPPPHFHVRYGEHSATIAIRPLGLLEGRLPPRIFGSVMEWAALHQAELLEDWRLARERKPVNPIAPLE